MKAGKVWGETLKIHAVPGCFEFHRIFALEGHECSKHLHKTKYNGFWVEQGILRVTVWQPSGTIDYTVLQDGDFMVVPPGVHHRFTALMDTVAFELYWAELHPEDIERENVGH